MSGLESIAALGLACNILQIVELGCQTVERIKTIYQGRKLDEEICNNAAALGSLTDEMKKHSQPSTKKLDKILLDAADKCSKAAQDLGEEIRFLVSTAKQGSLTSALKIASKVTWRQRRLERLKRNLEQVERLMKTSLLAQIW